jgi:hypothetical protein
LALHELRQFDAAIACYRQAIAIRPYYVEAFSNWGLAFHELKQFDAAISCYNQAIAIRPDYAEAYSNKGNALQKLKQFDAAIACYDQAIAIRPYFAQAFSNRGQALHELRQFDAAIDSFDQAIAISPDYAQVFSNRGNALLELKQCNAAIASYDQAISLKPDCVEAYFNRGNALLILKQFSAAVASYDQAIASKPDFADAFFNRGNAFQELKKFDAAIASYDMAIAIRPDYVDAFSNRGNALQELKEFDAAITSYNMAIAIRPDYVDAFSNKGNAQQNLKQFDAAIACYDQAIGIDPDYADAHWNKSLAMLLQGDYDNGWQLYEWRCKTIDFAPTRRNFTQPLWRGNDSIEGKSILLYSEQGLGDTLQFCRYIRLVSALGARVILEVEPALIGLLKQIGGIAGFVAKGDLLPEFDFHCPLLSLPLAFKTTIETIPSSRKYLSASADKVNEWMSRSGRKTKPRIGLVWSGSARHSNDRNRSLSLSSLKACLPGGYQYVSLQKEVREIDQAALRSGPAISHCGDKLKDFDETAALCELMDLVISVDTSVAHLSAALGKPTWILLPFLPDWRWLLDRNDSPWYDSVRLYRQESPGDWQSVLKRVHADLSTQAW